MPNFNILSIDGGGIKGLYSLYVLKTIEKQCCNGKNIIEYFNMIAGTSTGGIIALGLATGKSVDEIIDIYKKNTPLIFYHSPIFESLCKIMWPVFGIPYNSPNKLRELAEEMFGDKTMKDIKIPICIPSYRINTGTHVVFKNPHQELRKHIAHPIDENIKLVDVVMSTSAAPFYFPMYKINNITNTERNGFYVDGGIWANNPSLVAISDAIQYFDTKTKKIQLLSVGNVPDQVYNIPKNGINFWNILKFHFLIDIIFDSNSKATDHIAHILVEHLGGTYVRIDSTKYPNNKLHNIKLDDSNKKTIDMMQLNAEEYALQLVSRNSILYNPKINNFFDTNIMLQN